MWNGIGDVGNDVSRVSYEILSGEYVSKSTVLASTYMKGRLYISEPDALRILQSTCITTYASMAASPDDKREALGSLFLYLHIITREYRGS